VASLCFASGISFALLWTHRQDIHDHVEGWDHEESANRLPEYLERAGLAGKIMIAVTGASGVGKSSIVNALRRVGDSDAEAARTGVTETTLEPAMYKWRQQHGISEARMLDHLSEQAGDKALDVMLWDLPGLGTPKFPQAAYLRHMGVRHFDLVLVVTATRPSEGELRLLAELQAYGVPHFLVRNKIDADIESEVVRHEDACDTVDACGLTRQMRHKVAQETIQAVKRDLRRYSGLETVYCISSRRRSRDLYDFPQLIQDIGHSLAKHQKQN